MWRFKLVTVSKLKIPLVDVFIVDIHECSTDAHHCDKNAICINTNGSFTCACKNGYTGDGQWCQG